MGNLTFRGFVPKDDPMFSGGPEIFSRPESRQSPTTSAPGTTGVTPASKSSASDADSSTPHPMQPAANAYEAGAMDINVDKLAKD